MSQSRNITIQSINENNEIIKESTITVTPSSKIILHHDKDFSMQTVHKIHEMFVRMLESDNKIISLPETTKVSVLEIQ